VDNAQGVDVVYRLEDTIHDLCGLIISEGNMVGLPLFHKLPQCAHPHILHLDENNLFILKKLVDFDYIWMIKGQQQGRLLPQTLNFGPSDILLTDDLYRVQFIVLLLLTLVDVPERTLAKQVLYLEPL
jgi:hypothetical protein